MIHYDPKKDKTPKPVTLFNANHAFLTQSFCTPPKQDETIIGKVHTWAKIRK